MTQLKETVKQDLIDLLRETGKSNDSTVTRQEIAALLKMHKGRTSQQKIEVVKRYLVDKGFGIGNPKEFTKFKFVDNILDDLISYSEFYE